MNDEQKELIPHLPQKVKKVLGFAVNEACDPNKSDRELFLEEQLHLEKKKTQQGLEAASEIIGRLEKENKKHLARITQLIEQMENWDSLNGT